MSDVLDSVPVPADLRLSKLVEQDQLFFFCFFFLFLLLVDLFLLNLSLYLISSCSTSHYAKQEQIIQISLANLCIN